jgi:hypothetical protein
LSQRSRGIASSNQIPPLNVWPMRPQFGSLKRGLQVLASGVVHSIIELPMLCCSDDGGVEKPAVHNKPTHGSSGTFQTSMLSLVGSASAVAASDCIRCIETSRQIAITKPLKSNHHSTWSGQRDGVVGWARE